MKKIINRKMYNTETADLLGTYQYLQQDDYDHYREELYQTKKGTYFIYGEGNGLSLYSKYWEDNFEYSEGIRILFESEARKWAEKKLSADEYCKIFGEPEEG